jgi:uncharacterized caspase-like protein
VGNKNVAVVVGMSEYTSLDSLRHCKKDADLVKQLLVSTSRFDGGDVLCITDMSASDTKDTLREQFQVWSSVGVDEIFIYFSGHASYKDNQLLLCCADYSDATAMVTSVSLVELDDLVRTLSASSLTRIVDACHSGVQYVKDGGIHAMTHTVGAVSTSLPKDCRLWASSGLKQQSYASDDLPTSDFTHAFLLGATGGNEPAKPGKRILYRDIQNHIADYFRDRELQTPYFTSQGNNLEVFSEVSEALLSVRSEVLPPAPPRAGELPAITQAKQLSDVVAERDLLYVSRTEVDAALQQSIEHLRSATIDDELVAQHYTLLVHTSAKVRGHDGIKRLAIWIQEQKWQEQYFVKIEESSRRIKRNPGLYGLLARQQTMSLMNPYGTEDDDESRYETVYYPSGVSTTQELPYEVIDVRFTKKNPSLSDYSLTMAIFHSRTHVVVLSGPATYKATGWDQEEVDWGDVKWSHSRVVWKDVVANCDRIWKMPFSTAVARLHDRLLQLIPESDVAPGGHAAAELRKA